ncbi:retrovirus-related Pol polyprotein from transposon 17.6 [Trichonephila clavipes]|nr:retrovirus-related Pol polyprotein from transposon 17.6 [Trichonephila clavipes]
MTEGHLGLRRPLRVLSSTPTHRHLIILSGDAHEETGLQRSGTRSSLATNPDSISSVMTIVFMCRDPVLNASILLLLYRDTPLPHLWTLHCKKRKNVLLLEFLFLDSFSTSTGFGFIVRTAPQPQAKTQFQNHVSKTNHVRQEFFIGRDRPALPFQHPVSNSPLPSVQAISSSQKLIFAKRLVCGTAKSFLFSQRNLNTYESFKKALIEEFSDSVTSIEIHRELEKRKMYKTETLMQYFNSMRELANRCDSKIDEASIIQYVINGIDGPRSDKIILYGATSFSEFKQKLRTYETVIKNMGIHNSNSPNFRHSYESRGREFNQQSFQRKPTRYNVSDATKNNLF